jgi:hypothetical protein
VSRRTFLAGGAAAGAAIVPLLDSPLAVDGLPVTASSRVLEGNVAKGDSAAWRKLAAAGMVLLGHTHTDEFAFLAVTPQCGNPWNKTIVVTGASSGFGALTVRALGRAGHAVYAAMRQATTRNAPAVADLKADAHEAGLDLRPVEMDVSDQPSVASEMDRRRSEPVVRFSLVAGGPGFHRTLEQPPGLALSLWSEGSTCHASTKGVAMWEEVR